MKTFEELIQQSKDLTNKKELLKNSEPVIINKEVIIDGDMDDLGCIICDLLELFGLGADHMNLPGKDLMSMFGGDADIIITMGGPDEVYKSDNIKKVLKGAKGKLTKENVSSLRKSEKAEELKDLLAMFGDEGLGKIVKMKMFSDGGELEVEEFAQGGEVSTTEEAEKKFATGGLLENLSKIEVSIGKNSYTLYEAKTIEEREKGLQGVKDLNKNEGMIFYFDEPQTLLFWMLDTEIPLKLAFFNEDFECIAIKDGKPLSEDLIECDDALFVVELHPDADILLNDELDLPGDDDEYVMHVLAPDGSVQMGLYSGERIFSRKSTLTMIKKVKRAVKMRKKDPEHYENYVRLVGRYVFKELDALDNRDPEYVELDKKD